MTEKDAGRFTKAGAIAFIVMFGFISLFADMNFV